MGNQISIDYCESCKNYKPAFGFTTLSSGPGAKSEHMCPACFNKFAAARMGVTAPCPDEFAPVTVYDAVGKAHTFHFEVRLSTGLGIKAFEWIKDGPGGYIFQVLLPPDATSTDAYEKLVAMPPQDVSLDSALSKKGPGFTENLAHERMVRLG